MKNIILILTLFAFPLFAQISPGDLTKAHAFLEGISNCTKCHEIGKKVLNSKCLDCHAEIKQAINAGHGYHSDSAVKSKECASCHNEHHGRNFRIVNFDSKNFDHNKTGFKLTGAHANKQCKDCHQSKFISDQKLKKNSDTFLGLDGRCISCHEDYHKNSLGKNCADCHSTESFAKVEKFDHNKASFRLIGAHLQVACEKCHPKEIRNNKEYLKLTGISFLNCSSCHADVHKGSFGNNCKSCHSENSFHIINQKAFDHSKTNFPLIGKHQIVKCNDCHKGTHKNKPLFEKCIDCHSDYHKGDFTKNGVEKDCKSCHNEYGFKPALFTIVDHNLSDYKIDGSHLAVACEKCHYSNNEWKFKNVAKSCQNCHQNVHGNEITEKFFPGNKCETCHKTSNWKDITFDHNRTEFVLLGKHQNVSCGNCHYRQSNGDKKFKFSSLNPACEQCHQDVHNNQFTINGKVACENCHSFNNWSADKFDHSKAKFANDGAHKKLECSSCHKKVNENGKSFVLYKIKEYKCIDCHKKL